MYTTTYIELGCTIATSGPRQDVETSLEPTIDSLELHAYGLLIP